MGIQPGGEVLEDRRRLLAGVDHALALLADGRSAQAAEVEGVDFKEEAGRRGRAGVLLPGEPRSTAVADHLADEVACLANTPGGGALVVGIADDGTRIGAITDRDWLRQRIDDLVDVAPAIEERAAAGGERLLVVLVAEAREPIEDRSGRLCWRVGPSCRPVDRSEWWAQKLRRAGADPLAAETDRFLADITADAFTATRKLLAASSALGQAPSDLSKRDLYTRLGVVLPNGHLTATGVHMFCPAPRALIELTSLDVAGGDVVSTTPDLSGRSLVEQLQDVEARLDVLDKQIQLRSGFVLSPLRQIPWPAVREALLNAVVHRDWLPAETIQLTWVEADGTFEVVSPGGFAGGVTSDSVLSARYSRNPALADLARAMGLVERSGVGVDRMYREMVSLGHRPPAIRQEPGPRVRCRLAGGQPLAAVLAVTASLEPAVRRRDVRVALTLYAVLRDGYITAGTLAALLQVPPAEAEEALDVVADCTVNGEPMVKASASGVRLPSTALTRIVTADGQALTAAKRRGLLTWRRPDSSAAERLVEGFLAASGRISSGDVADITGLSNPAALQLLRRLEAAGAITRGGTATRGRNAHFIDTRSSAPNSSPT